MSKMELWDAVCQPPKDALSKITGGHLSGKTDIKPIWRIKAMTERFGECGRGWWEEIEKIWTEPGADGQVFVFVILRVFIEGWPNHVFGVGGAMLIQNTKNGLNHDDDAIKKACTDARSYALQKLGFGAEIYAGNYDGSKYKAEPKTTPKPPPQPMPAAKKSAPATSKESKKELLAKIYAIGLEDGSSRELIEQFLREYRAGEKITWDELKEVADNFSKHFDAFVDQLSKGPGV